VLHLNIIIVEFAVFKAVSLDAKRCTKHCTCSTTLSFTTFIGNLRRLHTHAKMSPNWLPYNAVPQFGKSTNTHQISQTYQHIVVLELEYHQYTRLQIL